MAAEEAAQNGGKVNKANDALNPKRLDANPPTNNTKNESIPANDRKSHHNPPAATHNPIVDNDLLENVDNDFIKDFKKPKEFLEFGSKIQKVVQVLKQIQKNEKDAKCIVFCQWEHLLEKVLNHNHLHYYNG